MLSVLIAFRVSLFQVYCNLGLKLERYTHTLSHTTQTHVHIYICINLILKTMNSHQCLQFQSITMGLIQVFSLSIFVSLFPNSKIIIIFFLIYLFEHSLCMWPYISESLPLSSPRRYPPNPTGVLRTCAGSCSPPPTKRMPALYVKM